MIQDFLTRSPEKHVPNGGATTVQLKTALHQGQQIQQVPDHSILVGDLVLIKTTWAKSFEPRYKEDYRIVQIYWTNALQVSDKRGKLHNVHITDVKCINMTEKVATH